MRLENIACPFNPTCLAERINKRSREDLPPVFPLDIVHVTVYALSMKRLKLEKALRDLGWKFLRHGGKHDVWTHGERQEAIPPTPGD